LRFTQDATTNEMARNVNEAAKGSRDITSNITGMARAAQGTAHGATETQKASQQLVEMSERLRKLVGQFKISGGESCPELNLKAPSKSLAAQASH
jgi:methyl-accepting chemotaxis protein